MPKRGEIPQGKKSVKLSFSVATNHQFNYHAEQK